MQTQQTKSKRSTNVTPIAFPVNSLPAEERSVNMSNALTRGAQGLNLTQKRIVAMALSCTDSKTAKNSVLVQNAGGWEVLLYAQDYAELYGIDANTAYDQLQEGAKTLLKSTWKTSDRSNNKTIIREGVWFILAEYSQGDGYVKLVFSPYIAEHLLSLRSQFTSYRLKQTAPLKSIYAWRLYECLESWKTTRTWNPTIEEFQRAMDAPESACKDFGNLRKGVIEPAIAELEQKNNLLISYETEKKGRKVIGLKFSYKHNPQSQLDLDATE